MSEEGGCCTCCSFACAVCRIIVYTCCRRVQYQKPRAEYNILCLGLEGSGKSTLLAKLAGESTGNLEPTKGFAYKSLLRDDAILQVQEVGGSNKIKQYWERYFANRHALIFVVDSSYSSEELLVVQQELRKAVTSSELQHRPVVILCNKQDKPDCKSSSQIKELLELQSFINSKDYFMEECSKGIDVSTLSCIPWLVETLNDQ